MKSDAFNNNKPVQFGIKNIQQKEINRSRNCDKGIFKKKSRLIWLRWICLGKFLECKFQKTWYDQIFKGLEWRSKDVEQSYNICC